MKVSDIKAIIPLAEVYELNPEAKYIVALPPSTREETVYQLIEAGKALKLQGALVMVDQEQLKFYCIE